MCFALAEQKIIRASNLKTFQLKRFSVNKILFFIPHHSNKHSRSNNSSPQDANLDGRWFLPDAARRLACDALLNGENLNANDLKQALPKDIYDGIDEKTAVTKWMGEQMDLSMAVDGLLGVS